MQSIYSAWAGNMSQMIHFLYLLSANQHGFSRFLAAMDVIADSPEELTLNVTWSEPLYHFYTGPDVSAAGTL